MSMQRSGQSLIEVLIATAVGTILLGGTLAIIVPALRGNNQAQNTQTGAALARELLDDTRVWADQDWNNLYSLTKGSGNHYYLSATSSPFTVVAGDETVTVSTTTFTRYFYVENVERTGPGFITTGGGTADPSTQKVTVAYSWPDLNAPRTISAYITRSRTRVLWQSDWSGGNGQSGPATTSNDMFASSTGIDSSTTTGSLRINGI